MSRRNLGRWVAPGALAVCAMATAAVVTGGGDTPEAVQISQAAVVSAPVGLARQYGVLRAKPAPTAASDAAAPDAMFGAKSGVDEPVDASTAVQATAANGKRFLVTANSEQLCFETDTFGSVGGGCGRARYVASDGFFTTTVPAPQDAAKGPAFVVDGLVPDGASSVTFKLSSGKASTAAVKENAVTAGLDARPLSAEFTDAAGRTHTTKFGGE